MIRFGGAWIAALAGAALLGGCEEGSTPEPIAPSATLAPARVPQGRGFDFYVLSLSWSPSYCEAEGEDANRQQCDSNASHGFIVHGLWPQWERGYPQDCETEEATVPQQRLRGLYDLIPSAGLIRHQWRKHGSCTGLSQDAYFQVMRAARERITIPDAFEGREIQTTIGPDEAEQAFIEANPGLEAEGVAVTCKDRALREVRLCLTKTLEFRRCPEVDARACRSSALRLPPVVDG